MKTFTANDLHEKRQEVYKAALQGPVKITHKFHGDFVLSMAKNEAESAECKIKIVNETGFDLQVDTISHPAMDTVIKIKLVDES